MFGSFLPAPQTPFCFLAMFSFELKTPSAKLLGHDLLKKHLFFT